MIRTLRFTNSSNERVFLEVETYKEFYRDIILKIDDKEIKVTLTKEQLSAITDLLNMSNYDSN